MEQGQLPCDDKDDDGENSRRSRCILGDYGSGHCIIRRIRDLSRGIIDGDKETEEKIGIDEPEPMPLDSILIVEATFEEAASNACRAVLEHTKSEIDRTLSQF